MNITQERLIATIGFILATYRDSVSKGRNFDTRWTEAYENLFGIKLLLIADDESIALIDKALKQLDYDRDNRNTARLLAIEVEKEFSVTSSNTEQCADFGATVSCNKLDANLANLTQQVKP
ncbi:MAG: hypothetical protein Q8M94_17360 [Ignavibacteria bacterium]|nr:hypothetical protein [Ignavibacteria bacterium]